jgi:hypothetical protein
MRDSWNRRLRAGRTKLGIDPMELQKMIHRNVMPSKAVVNELAKELDTDGGHLEKVVDQIKPA